MALGIKKNDRVRVLSGKDRGREGRVLMVMPDKGKALVEGINIMRKHERVQQTQQGQTGGIVSKEAPIALCKLALVDPKTDQAGRIRAKVEGGKKTRQHVKSGNEL